MERYKAKSNKILSWRNAFRRYSETKNSSIRIVSRKRASSKKMNRLKREIIEAYKKTHGKDLYFASLILKSMRILVPYDFTPTTRAAFNHAIRIAKTIAGKITRLFDCKSENKREKTEADFKSILILTTKVKQVSHGNSQFSFITV